MPKVKYGLKNAHYAVITETNGAITYGTPVAIPGSVELTLEPRGEATEFYADDIVYYLANSNQGYDGTFNVALIPDSFRKDVLGEVEDAEDLVLTEKADAQQKQFALMFEFTTDTKATRHVLYYCSATRPSSGSTTKTATNEPSTDSLTFIAGPRPTDNFVKTKTTDTTPEAIYDAWYSAVYEKVVTP